VRRGRAIGRLCTRHIGVVLLGRHCPHWVVVCKQTLCVHPSIVDRCVLLLLLFIYSFIHSFIHSIIHLQFIDCVVGIAIGFCSGWRFFLFWFNVLLLFFCFKEMNRANQQQLVQEANMGLVEIRQQELEYFQYFFSSFGTNSLLMAGFMISSLSQQNPGPDSDSNAPYPSIVFYWVSCALCACTGIYTLCGASVTQIFAQNLAIRGNTGSMVTSLEGMLQEQKRIIWSFLVTSVLFMCQADGMFWFRMDLVSSFVTSAVLAFFMLLTYHQLLRIYNRFNYSNKHDFHWDRTISQDVRDLRPSIIEDISSWLLKRPSTELNDATDPSLQNDIRESLQSQHAVIGDNTRKVDIEGQEPSMRNSLRIDMNAARRAGSLNSNNEMLLVGGMLTMRSRNRIGRSVWRRRFVVVKSTYIYFYRSRRDFTLNPQKPMNQRPIDLEGYTLIGGAASPPYLVTFAPIDENDVRKVWKFRCDTMAEFNRWIELFVVAIALGNQGEDMDEYIKFSPQNDVTIDNGMESDEED
jgi:hypothetical protein